MQFRSVSKSCGPDIQSEVNFFPCSKFPLLLLFWIGSAVGWVFFFLEYLSFQTVLDLCPNAHPAIQMSETNTAYVHTGQEGCVLPVPPSACPRTRRSLVQSGQYIAPFSYSTLTQQVAEEAEIFIWRGRKNSYLPTAVPCRKELGCHRSCV